MPRRSFEGDPFEILGVGPDATKNGTQESVPQEGAEDAPRRERLAGGRRGVRQDPGRLRHAERPRPAPGLGAGQALGRAAAPEWWWSPAAAGLQASIGAVEGFVLVGSAAGLLADALRLRRRGRRLLGVYLW